MNIICNCIYTEYNILFIFGATATEVWYDENSFDAIWLDYLAHVADEKTITARQCIKALVQVR